MIPPPPTPTLFPYTTLFRSLQLLAAGGVPVPPTVMAANASDLKALVELVGGLPVLIKLLTPSERPRSEEHTSELQSRVDLVCRLLLEKKKTKIIERVP